MKLKILAVIAIAIILYFVFIKNKKQPLEMQVGNVIKPKNTTGINEALKALNDANITNKFAQAAILAVLNKESGFSPKREKGYGNTKNSRIREIFGSRVADLNETELTELKKNDVLFFNKVYNMESLGNGPTDGYKFRGGGFNQLTGRANYRSIGRQINVDLEENPDLITEPYVAARAAAAYFWDRTNDASTEFKNYYKYTSINSFSDLNTAVAAMYHVNAGTGKSIEKILADVTGGRKKAFTFAPYFYILIKNSNS